MLNGPNLPLQRCPHCGIAKPNLLQTFSSEDTRYAVSFWCLYVCVTCGKMVLTYARDKYAELWASWPESHSVAESVPQRAREFLNQAAASLHTPAGAVMLTASAVDSMLKDKGYKDGVLNSRIKEAAKDHLITAEMADWAHEVRLEANEQRHADEEAPLPDETDARRSLEFAKALAQFLYVLPALVSAGRTIKEPKKVHTSAPNPPHVL